MFNLIPILDPQARRVSPHLQNDECQLTQAFGLQEKVQLYSLLCSLGDLSGLAHLRKYWVGQNVRSDLSTNKKHIFHFHNSFSRTTLLKTYSLTE